MNDSGRSALSHQARKLHRMMRAVSVSWTRLVRALQSLCVAQISLIVIGWILKVGTVGPRMSVEKNPSEKLIVVLLTSIMSTNPAKLSVERLTRPIEADQANRG